MLQEVKDSVTSSDAILVLIQQVALFLHTNHDGVGGIVLGLASWLAKKVVAIGSNPNNCCGWATVIINDTVIGFCSIYAPNSPIERTYLWEWIRLHLPNAQWIIGGNFKLVEHPSNRNWNNSYLLSQSKFEAWTLALMPLECMIPFQAKPLFICLFGTLGAIVVKAS